MAYKNLQFCWHGIASTDVAKAKAFYTEAIGWRAMEVDMGGDKATMFAANGIPRAHLSSPPPGAPSYWENYLRVENVDVAVKNALANGGTTVVPAMDIPPGRFAFVASPSGAVIGLFHEADESAAKNAPRDDMGGIHWVECHSTDPKADQAWLSDAFGITGKAMDMPGEGPPGGYTVLHDASDVPLGGLMQSMNPQAPSHWLAWVAVDDVDACLERVDRLDGTALTGAMDMEGIGRMAVVQDPTGAVFGVITPAQRQ